MSPYLHGHENHLSTIQSVVLTNETKWRFDVFMVSESLTTWHRQIIFWFVNWKSDKHPSSSSLFKSNLGYFQYFKFGQLLSFACNNIKNFSSSKARPHQMSGQVKILHFFIVNLNDISGNNVCFRHHFDCSIGSSKSQSVNFHIIFNLHLFLSCFPFFLWKFE